MSSPHIAKRPSVEPGTYKYWRWELRDFWMLMDTERDSLMLDRAFAALGLVAMQTRTKDAVEELALGGDLRAATLRYERAQLELLGIRRLGDEA